MLVAAVGWGAQAQPAEAHATSYGHWHYYGDADWNTYCGPYDIPGHGPANCYWPNDSYVTCNTYWDQWELRIRVQYLNGDWHYAYAYWGSC